MNEVAILYAGTDTNKLERVDAYLPAYTVTFNVDGEMYDTQKVKYGKVATAPETAPTKEGYTFDGWDYDFSAVTGDVTVNAKWEVNTYTVTFNVNDETYFETTVPYGTGASAFAQVPNPEKAGYTFVGWVYENGEEKIDIRTILPLTICFDHRALDFAEVAPFIRKLEEIFNNPEIILGE